MEAIVIKNMFKSFLALIFCIGLGYLEMGCTIIPTPDPRIPNDTYACGAGCTHLLSLTGRDKRPGCEEARILELPNGDIRTCEQFCIETQNNGRSLHPSCWITLGRCQDIETACRR